MGLVNVFNPLGIVLSVYNILFALLILITELKNWPIITSLNRRVDVYFHLLSIPTGKGGFYCFVGTLAFFATPWNVSRICILIVAIVGAIQLIVSCRGGDLADSTTTTASLAPPLASQDVTSQANPFTSFAAQVRLISLLNLQPFYSYARHTRHF